ncbi:hypothetical protein D9I44_23245 [Escherichia coli]|nr:hypothetical protein [Escherichia coli]
MGSPSLYSARKTTLALAVALSFAWQAPVFAHGGEAHMVPMDKTLKEFGADVQWDDYAQLFTLIKDGAYVKVKPGAQTAIVNGQPLALQVPVKRRTKNAKAFHDKCENFSFRASNETAVLITAFYSLHGDHLGYG